MEACADISENDPEGEAVMECPVFVQFLNQYTYILVFLTSKLIYSTTVQINVIIV